MSNVISLSDRKIKKIRNSDEEVTESFTDIMKKNAETKERERKERLKANKGVIRSHRLNKK